MDNSPSIATRLFYFVTDDVAEVDDPTLPQIMAALRTLDGRDIDTFSVTLRNGDSIDVGGGANDHYKCHARTSGSFYDLVNPAKPLANEPTMGISMDEELSTYPICCIVPLQSVLTAVETFATTGVLDPSLSWTDSLDYQPL